MLHCRLGALKSYFINLYPWERSDLNLITFNFQNFRNLNFMIDSANRMQGQEGSMADVVGKVARKKQRFSRKTTLYIRVFTPKKAFTASQYARFCLEISGKQCEGSAAMMAR